MKRVSAFLIGAVFGLGIALAGMANPAKVLNFFDLAGSWDPSLVFVMGGALVTTAIGYRIVFGARQKPVLEAAFNVPASRVIDRYLVGGSALFGIGWGIAGFCPGGAIPALGLGYGETFQFVGAMIAGILAARLVNTQILQPAIARSA
ncbi:MAG: YeeE/YedE family protein [Nitratireductor sp.]|nr:YeeE/YedE family protein [Nitratireductor sp.]